MTIEDAVEIVLRLAQKSAVSVADWEAIATVEDFAVNHLGDG